MLIKTSQKDFFCFKVLKCLLLHNSPADFRVSGVPCLSFMVCETRCALVYRNTCSFVDWNTSIIPEYNPGCMSYGGYKYINKTTRHVCTYSMWLANHAPSAWCHCTDKHGHASCQGHSLCLLHPFGRLITAAASQSAALALLQSHQTAVLLLLLI